MSVPWCMADRVNATASGQFFDDFSYTSPSDARLAENGWYVRSRPGGPGITGAKWAPGNVTFPVDTVGQVLRLKASTSGTAKTTVQAEVGTTSQKFFEGTYAARVYFSDTPASGTDGDLVNQTFFTISPYNQDKDPLYSELDFEYLPNGGWGTKTSTLFNTSYFTYTETPQWWCDCETRTTSGSLQGWHTLVMQVMDGTVTYLVDSKTVFETTDKYYPRQGMSIVFNHWFLNDGLLRSKKSRTYEEKIDWVYFAEDELVTPDAIATRVSQFRSSGTTFTDTVLPA